MMIMKKIKNKLGEMNRSSFVLTCFGITAVVMGIYAFMVTNSDIASANAKVEKLAQIQLKNELVIVELNKKIVELQKIVNNCPCAKQNVASSATTSKEETKASVDNSDETSED